MRPIIKSSAALILDDDPVFNQLMRQVLKKFGIHSESFERLETFSARLEVGPPALCIVDLNLNGAQSGLDAVAAVRTRHGRRIPVFVVSGTRDDSTIAHALECGADDYLLKPLDREVLLAKLLPIFQTPELELRRSESLAAKSVELDTQLRFDVELVEVDELGLTLSSPHLVPKGTVIDILIPELAQAIQRDRALRVTASLASLEAGSTRFLNYFEFDLTDETLLTQIRDWLTRESGAPAS